MLVSNPSDVRTACPHGVYLHSGFETATGYSIICLNCSYLSRQTERTPEIDARESPLATRLYRGVTSTYSEYMIPQKKSSAIPSTSSHPKKHRSERANSGEATVVKTAANQTTSTISVADLVPLCGRTQLCLQFATNSANKMKLTILPLQTECLQNQKLPKVCG